MVKSGKLVQLDPGIRMATSNRELDRLINMFSHKDIDQAVTIDSRVMMFLLSGLYCAVAIIFLVVFSLESLAVGRTVYGMVLLGFSATTLIFYVAIWFTGRLHLAGLLVSVLMAMLCLFLFYSGGTNNTGALWYFIYPPLVIFLQDIRKGMLAVLILMLATLSMYYFHVPGFEQSRYSNSFLERFVAVYFVIAILSCLFAWFRNIAEAKLEHANEQLKIISVTDSLSGLPNRRCMNEHLANEILRSERFQLPFTIILLDIDHFKKVNDSHGHPFGDLVIKKVAEILTSSIRRIDTACRWGGEEFLVLLPGTNLQSALVVAERLRSNIHSATYNQAGITETISASLGLAQFSPDCTVEDCIKQADKCLYQAKSQGRNCIVVAGAAA